MSPARALFLAVLLSAVVVPARADTWLGGAVTDWFSPLAWSDLLGPPTASENAFFSRTVFGVTPANTSVSLPGNATIVALSVDIPSSTPYVFTGSNGAILTATSQMDFQNTDRRASNVTSVSSMRLNTPDVDVLDNAILSLNNATVTTNFIGTVADGRIDVNNGSSVQTLGYGFDQAAGELRVNSGGELRISGDTTLQRGTTTINSGGQLNALSGVDLEYSGTALLQFGDSHAVDDGVHLKATAGGDITAGGFIDVGNSAVGSLTVTGAGSTLTAQSSTSDWGAGSSGNATVTISNSGLATASQLRAGTGSAVFQGNVTSGGTLRTTSTFRMGGGSTVRTVSLNVDGGTLETTGLATFDDKADLNLVSGTVAFNGGATFNSGGRIDWSGGTLNLGASSTLLVDAGVFNRTNTTGFIFSNTTTTRIRNGGSFTTPSYFDLGNATLDMNNGTLTVGTTGGTISDWAQSSSTTTTATLSNNAVATYRSGLRMSQNGGTTSATISSGARLVSNGSFSAGGTAASNVTLNVTGGRVESDGTIILERGTTTTVSAAGVMEGQNIVLGSSGGTTSTTVTGADSLLKAQGTLTAGRVGTSTLSIFSGGKAESLGSTIIGELAGADATVTLAGAGSRLEVASSLTIGAGGTGQLNIGAGGYVPVIGGVTVGSSGTLFLTSGGSSIETTPGQSIVNNGLINASPGSQLRTDVTSAGTLNLNGSSISRSLTLQANSAMFVDNAMVGSLTHQAGADIKFQLRSAADFDDLAVTGAASLAGDFVVTLDGGFAPTLGMTFPIFTAGSISGAPNFDFSAAPLGSGLSWGVSFAPTSLSLVILPGGTAGDFDNDGDVDGRDFLKWQRGESTNPFSAGDLATWQAEYNGGSLVATSTTVPEPGAWLLTMGMGIVWCVVQRK